MSQRGFEAGRQEWSKVIPLAIAGGTIALMCRRSVPVIIKVVVFYSLLFAAFVGLVPSPLLLLLLMMRPPARWRMDHRPAVPAPVDPDGF